MENVGFNTLFSLSNLCSFQLFYSKVLEMKTTKVFSTPPARLLAVIGFALCEQHQLPVRPRPSYFSSLDFQSNYRFMDSASCEIKTNVLRGRTSNKRNKTSMMQQLNSPMTSKTNNRSDVNERVRSTPPLLR